MQLYETVLLCNLFTDKSCHPSTWPLNRKRHNGMILYTYYRVESDHQILYTTHDIKFPNISMHQLQTNTLTSPCTQSDGLAWSVHPDSPQLPPSTLSLFQCLAKHDPAFHPPGHGSLQHWAKQGVFLFNMAPVSASAW